ncbi:MAG: chorismate-binding protein [Thermoanaerobaculia bacterium]|nr:chorismate-binding protein [Thermoanaerobaculia bacterium]
MNEGIRRALLRAEPGAEAFLRFEAPVESRQAHRPEQVPALLAWAEEGAAAGDWMVGFVGYEAAPAFDAALVAHPPAAGPAPLAAFGRFRTPATWLPAAAPVAGREAAPLLEGEAQPALDAAGFRAAVERIRAAIAAGETYQVNVSFPLRGRLAAPAVGEALLEALLAPGEAPYAAWFEGEGWAVLSLSPELFFERRAGRVVSRPMKGTRPRGRFPREDAARGAELRGSEKDRAENLMIVDMIRNDLGRLAEPGSVTVERALEVERYPTVWQLTSTVSARTAAPLPELFTALFPCASITGAPKAATSRFIRELEAEPRGIYCGAIGRLEPGGAARFAVAIRTLEIDRADDTFRYGVGAGITWDSDPAEEWRECLAKARVLAGAPPRFDLIETMRWRAGRGVELFELHLDRLAASADYFGFDPARLAPGETGDAPLRQRLGERVRRELAARCAGLAAGSWRVRLRLARSGELTFDVEPFAPPRHVWTVAIAAGAYASTEVTAFHKTTRRERYAAARAVAPAGVDEVLLVNEHGELTEGTRTNLMVQFGAGPWVTPPLEAGLLPGVFRESLLRRGEAIEATLRPRDLRRAHRIRLVNALRGWIPVRLAPPVGRA